MTRLPKSHLCCTCIIINLLLSSSFRFLPKWNIFYQSKLSLIQFPIRLHNSIHSSSSRSEKTTKFIVVTGGVISGIGKGITASSMGVILKMLEFKPTAMKIDPYLNVDAGTMSPFEHGETFVLDDGAETDLDLGNYERFLDVKLTNHSSLTTGKIYQAVISKERRGDYLGKTVQIIPHITDEIMSRIISVAERSVDDSNMPPNVCIVELGGTIGDIESMPFVEAVRQLQLKLRPENLCIVHVSMVPTTSDGEQKTKPTQHSVKELRSLGLAPDFIVCRSKNPLDVHSKTKISLFCNVPVDNVLSMHDLSNIYHAPLVMIQQGFHHRLAHRLGLPISIENNESTLALQSNTFYSQWSDMTNSMDGLIDDVTITVIGKYTNLADSYLSLISAIKHSCVATRQRLRLLLVESSHLEAGSVEPEVYNEAWERVRQADGVVVPGGFGSRGAEGKIEAIRYVRENRIPFLGVCLGMQMAVIEYCRHILQISAASSEEFETNPSSPRDSAVVFMPEGSRETLGGTMRLGSRTTLLRSNSLASKLYGGSTVAEERHRHRYEVNPTLVDELEKAGLIFSGKDDSGVRMEIVELPSNVHPYFVGVQFHPEFKSRPLRPAPVFLGLLQAIKSLKNDTKTNI